MRTTLTFAAAALLLAGAADARPQRAAAAAALPEVWYQNQTEPEPDAPVAVDYADWDAPAGNPYFYPDAYDPQYGSAGQPAAAATFAARYGCRPVWNANLNRYVPACN